VFVNDADSNYVNPSGEWDRFVRKGQQNIDRRVMKRNSTENGRGEGGGGKI